MEPDEIKSAPEPEVVAEGNGHVRNLGKEQPPPTQMIDQTAHFDIGKLKARVSDLERQQKLLVVNFLILSVCVAGCAYAVKKGATPSV